MQATSRNDDDFIVPAPDKAILPEKDLVVPENDTTPATAGVPPDEGRDAEPEPPATIASQPTVPEKDVGGGAQEAADTPQATMRVAADTPAEVGTSQPSIPEKVVQINAVLMSRVSTEQQGSFGHSLQAQERILREYCDQQGWQVIKTYTDEASGADFNRPGWLQFEQDLANGLHCDVVLCLDMTRFSRDVRTGLDKLDWLQKRGIQLVLPNMPGIDSKTPEGEFFRTLQLGFGRLERKKLVMRVKMGQEQASLDPHTITPGRAAWGYVARKKVKTIRGRSRAVVVKYEIPPKKADFVRTIFTRMADEPITISSLRKEYDIPFFTLEKILRNRWYLGESKFRGAWRKSAVIQIIIDEPLFLRVQTKLDWLRKCGRAGIKPYTNKQP